MVHPKTENIRLSFQTKEVPAALFHPVKANAVKHHKKKHFYPDFHDQKPSQLLKYII